jgi:hypothetical protein
MDGVLHVYIEKYTSLCMQFDSYVLCAVFYVLFVPSSSIGGVMIVVMWGTGTGYQGQCQGQRQEAVWC